jgi:geranylgeranyl pyrophosphate synthase
MAEENDYKVEDIVPLAVVLELIHNASLIIDDIQDSSEIRCGKLTLWKKVGIPLSVNAAYFMAHIALAYYNYECQKNKFYNYAEIIIKGIDELGSGQQLDLEHSEMTFNIYEQIVTGKTGALLKLSLLFGLMPYEYNDNIYNQIVKFIKLFSCAYQIGDDLEDLKAYKKNTMQKIDSSNIYFCYEKELDLDLVDKRENEIVKYKNDFQAEVYETLMVLSESRIIKTKNLEKFIDELWKTKK